MRDPRIWKLGSGTKTILQYAAQSAALFHDTLASHSAQHGAPDLLLAPVTAFGARLMREKAGIPLVTVHLQPAVILSAHDTPVLFPAIHPLLRLLPAPLKSILFRYGPNPLDLFAGPILRRLCKSLDIPAPKSFFRDWWDSPDGALLLFPDWFAPPQPDWPQPRLQTTFPLEDLASENPLSPSLQAFLARHQHTPPIVFTAGSANVQASAFFATAAAALAKLRLPGVFVTRDLAQLPPHLPDSIHTADYVPFSPLLRHASAFVHHGGIGTLSQGFAAGIPQLLMPMAHDQPDNAHRLRRLIAGDSLTPRQFTPDRVAASLAKIIHDPAITASARHLASQVSPSLSTATLPAIIDWLQSRAATSAKATPA
jgi:rhamnosyltransferase subunit B